MTGVKLKAYFLAMDGYARRDFMVPIPYFNSWDELNEHLEAERRKRRQRRPSSPTARAALNIDERYEHCSR
jgi:hypothetical protein